MNLTVGPLPPAVYWRRRAIVLGGLLVVILLAVYSCGGSTTPNASHHSSGAPGASLSPRAPSPSVSSPRGSFGPSTVPSGPSTAVQPSLRASPFPTTPAPVSTPPASATTPATTACSDKEVKVFPVISSTSAATAKLQYGGTYDIKLEIKNISTRTCTRDVGTVPEELYIMRGKTKIWSSDDCGPTPGKTHDVRSFNPGVLIYADLKWSSYDITTHNCKKGTTPAAADTYQLFARDGTKVSSPVKFVIQP